MGAVPLCYEVHHYGSKIRITAESIQTGHAKDKKADCPQRLIGFSFASFLALRFLLS